jgi:hypothetical protein
MTIAALYVDAAGVYRGVPGVELWDIKRDARTYRGPWSVVAHPPCSTWCQLAHVNQKRYGHQVGDDGGCFEAALLSVREFGGVLEHPAHSYAWERFGLPPPRLGRWKYGGDGYPYGAAWVTKVYQRAYGHRASKATWLYVVGPKPDDLDWSDPEPIATVSFLTNHGGGDLPRLSKAGAKATPPRFRDLLLSIARRCAQGVGLEAPQGLHNGGSTR